MGKHYIRHPVGPAELRSLLELADAEERAFFDRNPHLARPYRRRLLAIALCQGAALQYIRRGRGVNDFDVHFFYAQNPAKPRLARAVKRISDVTVGTFKKIPVDFIRTIVPITHADLKQSLRERIEAFLREGPTSNAVHLSKKAVVGLFPKTIFAKVLWKPQAQPIH